MALALGIWDVDGMLKAMSNRQFINWQWYQSMYGPVNPLIRGDIQASIIASETFRTIAKNKKRIKRDAFLPFPIEPKSQRKQSVAQMRLAMTALTARANG